MIPSLPASTTRSWPSSAGALEPRSVSFVLRCSWSVGRERLAQAQAGERELEHAVAEVGGPVPGRVAGVDQDAPAAGLHHRPARATGSPSRSPGSCSGRAALRRFAQSVLNTPLQAPARAVDQDHVALIGRARRRSSRRSSRSGPDRRCSAPRRASRGSASRVMLTGQPPAGSSLPSASDSLWISPFGRGRVDELPVGVEQRAGGGDLRSCPPSRGSPAG